MDLAKKSLQLKEILEKNMEKGLYPYSKFYLADIKKHLVSITRIILIQSVF